MSRTRPSHTESVVTPTGSKENIRQLYDVLNDQLGPGRRHSFFLNFGFVDDGPPPTDRVDPARYLFHRNAVRLVLEMVGDHDLTGLTVLDVGCGRGGTVMLLDEHFGPRLAVGLDISWNGLAFSKARLRPERLGFVQGDAEQLPFKDGSFDVVMNLESSHNYPDPRRFYVEVGRILRPGGALLYADLFDVRLLPEQLQSLRDAGLEEEAVRDITPNVLRSRDQAATRQLQSFEAAPQGGMTDLMGLPGSRVYQTLAGGEAGYYIIRMRKRS